MRWLVDNSVLQRYARSRAVVAAVRARLDHGDVLCSTPVTVLEAGYSARSADDHSRLLEGLLGAYEPLPLTPESGEIAIALQRALWDAGSGRGAGARDLLTAGTAIASDSAVLHYDADFELLASVDDRLQ